MASKNNNIYFQILKKYFVEKNSVILSALIIFTLFLFKSYFFLDPDFGFHIKVGELILTSGIPATDPFSYTMPSFPYIDHEWLLDVLMYLSFENLGWGLLVIIFSFVAILSLVIPVLKYKKFVMLPLLFAGFTLFLPMGIRPQVFSWLFFSVLISIFLNENIYKKVRFLIPILFLVWINLHGSFGIGLLIFMLFIFIRVWNERKIDFVDVSIFLISVLFTLINPYGISLWREVFMTTFDASLRGNIHEWRPSIFSFYPVLWFYITFSIILFLKFRMRFNLFHKLLYFSVLLAGLMSSRNMAFWAIVALPVLVQSLIYLNEEVKKIKYGEVRLRKAYVFFIFLVLFAFIAPIIKNENQFMLFNKNYFYPDKAILYLKSNPTSGNVFSDYNWGGYLIWKYPEKKVFVDGRMPSWNWDKAGEGESGNAFLEYNNILNGNVSFDEFADKYNIDTILWSKPKELDDSFISNLILKQELKNIGKYGNLSSQLMKDDWTIIYKDETSVIFRKTKLE